MFIKNLLALLQDDAKAQKKVSNITHRNYLIFSLAKKDLIERNIKVFYDDDVKMIMGGLEV